MSSQQVEMPNGTTRQYSAMTIQELKAQVAATIGVDADEVAILDGDGRPVPEYSSPPQSSRIIPKPKWGEDEC